MQFGLSEDHQRLRARAIEFARDQLSGESGEHARADGFDRAGWLACARFGIQGLVVPAEYGGAGLDPLSLTVAMEGLGYGCCDNGLLFALGAQICSIQAPLMRFGTPEQKQRYLPGLCDGTVIGAHAMTEASSGSDAFSLATTAVPDGDDYVLDGSKCFITAAPLADVALVFAKTKPGGGFAGVSAFLVDRGTPGLEIGPPMVLAGLHTAPLGTLALQECRVPATQMLGGPGSAFAIFNHSMEWERSHILASAVGTMQRQLEAATAHVRDLAHGDGEGSQVLAHRIVDLELRVRTSRLVLYEVAWLRSQGRSASVESALAKLWVSESYLAASLDVLAVHGTAGDLESTGLARELHDAVGSRIYSGTSDIQRNIVAARLGL